MLRGCGSTLQNCRKLSETVRNCRKPLENCSKSTLDHKNLGKPRCGSCPGGHDTRPDRFPAPQRFWEPRNRSLSSLIFSNSFRQFRTVSDSFRQFRTVSDSFGQNRKSSKNHHTPHQFRKAFQEPIKKRSIQKLRPGRMYTMVSLPTRTDKPILLK